MEQGLAPEHLGAVRRSSLLASNSGAPPEGASRQADSALVQASVGNQGEVIAELAPHQARVVQASHADGEVETLFNHMHLAVGQLELKSSV